MNLKFIGCGPTKCGSTSLYWLLKGCGFNIEHERWVSSKLTWCYQEDYLKYVLRRFEKNENYGEIGFYFLPYIPKFIAEFSSIKVVCMKRPLKAFIKSFLAQVKFGDHYANPLSFFPTLHNLKTDTKWDYCYPRYWDRYNRRSAEASFVKICARLFHRNYYAQAEVYQKLFPKNFKIFDIEDLNSREGQDRIFEWVGISKEKRVYRAECRFNVTGKGNIKP